MAPTGSFNSVSKQASDRHRAYAPWDRRERTSYTARPFKIHVTNQFLSTLALDAVDPDVDDNSAWLDPFTSDEFGLPDCRNKNIRAATHRRKIFGLGMSDCDCAIFSK